MKDRTDTEYADKPHIMIIEARFYADIADFLAEGALAELEKDGVTCERFTVPGALEIPAAIQYAVRGLDFYTARRRFDAYVALGCVIRGETTHYEIVAGESARGLMDLALGHTLAVGNGIITCENREQALERARPNGKNSGGRAARAALDMLELKSRFGIFPR